MSGPFQGRLPEPLVRSAVAAALAEDLSLAGDITTDAIIPPEAEAAGVLMTRAPGIIAGLQVAAAAFHLLDPHTRFEARIADGARAPANAVVARVAGKARALLTAERVALNFVGR